MSYLDIIVVFLDTLVVSRLAEDLGHLLSRLEKEDKKITLTKRIRVYVQ